MHNTFFVRGDQALRNLRGVINRLTTWDRTIEQALAQGLPFEQLGDDVRRAVVHADVINGNNIGMTQGGGGTRLLLETAQPVLIMGEGGFEDLEGHVPPQPFVAGAVYFPHPPKAYLFQHSIVTQDLTNHAKLKRLSVG